MPPAVVRGLGVIPSRTDPLGTEYEALMLKPLGADPAVSSGSFTKNRDIWTPPRVRDQIDTNGCVGFSGSTAVAAAHARARYIWSKNGGPAFDAADVPTYSALFGWYMARRPEERHLNVGCLLRDFAVVAERYGLPLEAEHPMTATYKTDMAKQPSSEAYAQAARHQVYERRRIADGDVESILMALRAGLWVHYAFPVFQSYFDSANAAKFHKWEGPLVGYHAEALCDIDAIEGSTGAVSLGSWGDDFAHKGYTYRTQDQLRTAFDIHVYAKTRLVT